MKIPIRVTLKSSQIVSSFTVIDEIVALPFPNDQFIFVLNESHPFPSIVLTCQVSHIIHYCGGKDATCLIVLDRILLESSEQYAKVIEAFSTLYDLENVEHIEIENDALYQRICALIGYNPDCCEYELVTPHLLQEFTKLVAETFRCLLVTEISKNVRDVNFDSTNDAVIAVHNAIIANKDRNGRVNLRQVLVEFNQMFNPKNLFSWSAPFEQVQAASEIIYQKANINHILGKSTV